jgi:hypothetical protein
MLSVRAAGPTIHHEALDWAKRASSNGGTISTTTIRAVSDFCAAIDRGGLRSSMYRLNLFAGGNLSGCLVPLYRGPTFGGTAFGNSTDTNANFVSADFVETGATGGLKGNGTNKYLDTGLASSSLASNFNLHESYSATSLENSGTSPRVVIGAIGAGNFQLWGWNFDVGRISQIGSGGGSSPSVPSPASNESHLIGNRTSATNATIFSNGSIAGTNATSASATNFALPVFVFATNNGASPSSYTAARLRLYSVGLGFTNTQAAAFSAAVIAFNTALGR